MRNASRRRRPIVCIFPLGDIILKKNMRKRINGIAGIIIGLVLTSCGTGRIASLDRKPTEAIIVAKIQIKNGDSFIENK